MYMHIQQTFLCTPKPSVGHLPARPLCITSSGSFSASLEPASGAKHTCKHSFGRRRNRGPRIHSNPIAI